MRLKQCYLGAAINPNGSKYGRPVLSRSWCCSGLLYKQWFYSRLVIAEDAVIVIHLNCSHYDDNIILLNPTG